MTTPSIDGFEYHRVQVAPEVALNAAVAGQGSPVVLLHGFPQTHLCWRRVAPELAENHTVIVPDLRGYGDSDKPAESGPDVYSKRTMADDVVALAAHFGFDKFALVGHDRGALVAIRAGLDHPDRITHLGSLDVLPTLDMWDVMHGVSAAVGFHLYLMAQPAGLPEAMIRGSADTFFGHFLDAWGADGQAIPADIRARYLQASAAAIDSIVADYRASAGIDLEHDRQDRAAALTLRMPVTVIQQDWGLQMGFDGKTIWQSWAPDLDYRLQNFGHFMAEQSPAEVVRAIADLLKR